MYTHDGVECSFTPIIICENLKKISFTWPVDEGGRNLKGNYFKSKARICWTLNIVGMSMVYFAFVFLFCMISLICRDVIGGCLAGSFCFLPIYANRSLKRIRNLYPLARLVAL